MKNCQKKNNENNSYIIYTLIYTIQSKIKLIEKRILYLYKKKTIKLILNH